MPYYGNFYFLAKTKNNSAHVSHEICKETKGLQAGLTGEIVKTKRIHCGILNLMSERYN